MKIEDGQLAPQWKTVDIYNNPVSLSDRRGKKVLLSFMRNAGCPVCNFRFHQLLQQADSLKSRNVEVILVYESTKDKMMEYLEAEQYPFTFIADPGKKLYRQYAVEKSFGKFMGSMFHGLMGKAREGGKLFKTKIRQDGELTTIGADFLIDNQGKVLKAHYGRFVGDHLPIEALR